MGAGSDAAAASIRIALARPEHVSSVGKVLAASHADYPSFRHVFPDPTRRAAVLRTFFTGVARDAVAFEATYTATVDDRVLGVAIWLPPGRFPWSAGRQIRFVPTMLSVLRIAPRSFMPFARYGANAARFHPTDKHWYLVVLGVKPEAQGLGIGTRLLQPILARADQERLPCYLETAREENVAFYQRRSFRVEHEALPLVPDGPTHWAMRRSTLSTSGDR
ncbi:MAG: GNAT family N-acetyltransferase [Thermomicrobiales bacterium]